MIAKPTPFMMPISTAATCGCPVWKSGEQSARSICRGRNWVHVWSGDTYAGGSAVTVAAPLGNRCFLPAGQRKGSAFCSHERSLIMDPHNLAGLLAISFVAAYTQTLTGFCAWAYHDGWRWANWRHSLPDAAVLVSILVVVNAVQVLAKGWKDIAFRQFFPLLAQASSFCVSVLATRLMLSASLDWLKIVLGLLIVVSAFSFP